MFRSQGACPASAEAGDCGYFGITQEECLARQCCWQPTDRDGAPWCLYRKDMKYTCAVTEAGREDCGWFGIKKDECERRNCCWQESDIKGANYCYFRKAPCPGYQLSSPKQNGREMSASLTLSGECGRYGPDLPKLQLKVTHETPSRLHVKIYAEGRYEIPDSLLPPPSNQPFDSDPLYDFTHESNPFSFRVLRKSTGEELLNTKVKGMDSLVFEEEYLEISSILPKEAHIYGLGEVVHAFRRDPKQTLQTMWARDAATPIDENVYGSHPFYMEVRNGTAHGVFLRNSNGMDVILNPGKITYKVLGGVLDFYILMGPTPTDVIQQYTEVVGRPAMPPLWSLGFHQCRYGFKNIEEVATVVRRFREEKIPLDTIWMDIDYMEGWKDFTLDPVNFTEGKVRAFTQELQKNDQHMVIILDPGIKIERGHLPYDEGVQLDIFLKNEKGKNIVGNVWPGYTLFPDFLNPKTSEWWERHIRDFSKRVEFDGLWIDMNEVASWCDGECNVTETEVLAGKARAPIHYKRKLQADSASSPPYRINNAGKRASLDQKTVSVKAVHANGLKEYNVHNLYGHSEAIATDRALRNVFKGKRPFILTRSTFAGTGSYAAHWSGDNWSQWLHLYLSIPAILNFQLFGIPLTGTDICGFIGEVTEELCLRWMQLGAFFPFSRNHNAINEPDQYPYVWPSVAKASREALLIRYSMLPYIYTLFYDAHTLGATVWRPLFFEFPNESETLMIDRQVMLGDAILISPALDAGARSVSAYFPRGMWYDFHTRTLEIEERDSGSYHKIKAPLEKIPLHIRGGRIVPLQHPEMTTAATRRNEFILLIAPDSQIAATGRVYLDDGQSEKIEDNYSDIKFQYSDARLSGNGKYGYQRREGTDKIGEIVVFGVKGHKGVKDIQLNSKLVNGATVDIKDGTAVFKGLSIPLTKEFVLSWKWE
ncbi:uncharacterized protein VTP21DRAFT_2115 [Calcarisporiella thermophila]|uniref:uncharacterized protein n=1 Tax=Calcarisporiella thermophila TaxID=911321 RepID=UPI003744AEF7